MLFLVRHAESSGAGDSSLSEKGIIQAKALKPWLTQFSFDKIYSSELKRASETAKLGLTDKKNSI